MYLDSHCHLNDDALFQEEEAVISRAFESGVSCLLVVGWDEASSRKAVEIAHRHEGVFAAVGFHPENLENVSEEAILRIESLASDEKVIAIGECGLDYHYFKDPADREKQKRWFIRQIELANKLHLPLSIHAREAYGDTLEILKAHPAASSAVLHCYSGSVETMKEFAKLGYYFGFDGPITFKNAVTPKECVKACPIDRLLFETDSPYMAPVPHRGHPNEPSFVVLVYEEAAKLRETPVFELQEAVIRNFEQLFHVKL